MKNKLFFVIVLLLMPLSGCGIISIGYNYADAYLRYSVNSYATFNDEQKETIKAEVNTFMAWHRTTMLPRYAGFLQGLQSAAQSDKPLKKDDVARLRNEMRALYVETLTPAIKPAASLLVGVDAAQVQEMAQSFAKENIKQREKELGGSHDERLRKRAEKVIDILEGLVGGLNDSQLETIREISWNMPYATDLYLAQREDNQARLLGLLKRDIRNEAEVAALLTSWLYTPESNRSAEDNRAMLAFEDASDEMIAGIYQMLTARQKKTLLKNIAKYIKTFEELAGQP